MPKLPTHKNLNANPLFSAPLAVLDLETSGLNPSKDHILEVAVVLLNSTGIVEHTWSTLVRPNLKNMPDPQPLFFKNLFSSPASKIHQIDYRDLAFAPTYQEIWPYLQKLLENRIIVAHNKEFDLSFLDSASTHLQTCKTTASLSKNSDPIPLTKHPSICTLQLARNYLDQPSNRLQHLRHSLLLPNLQHQKLSPRKDLTKNSNPSQSNSHQALADALATAQLLIYLASQTHWNSFNSTAQLAPHSFKQSASAENAFQSHLWPKDLFVQRGKYQRFYKHLHNLWWSQENRLCISNSLVSDDFSKFIKYLSTPQLFEEISFESRTAILNWLCPLLSPLDLMGVARLLGLAT